MRESVRFGVVTALLLLQALQLVHGHGDHTPAGAVTQHGVMHSNMTTSSAATQNAMSSYFADGSHSVIMAAHVGLLVLAWVFVLPIGVMFSIANYKLAIPTQIAFFALNVLGVAAGTVFNVRTPDLYPNNAHHKIGWVATWVMAAHLIMSVLLFYSNTGMKLSGSAAERTAFLPLSSSAISQLHRETEDDDVHRWSGDSGVGTASPSPSEETLLADEHRRDLLDRLQKVDREEDSLDDVELASRRSSHFYWRLDTLLNRRSAGDIPRRLVQILNAVRIVIERISLPLGFIAITTGGVTYAGIFRANMLFNGLAHFIKGGIFFWYGILTLGRWVGAFADFGWAWNVKPSRNDIGPWIASIPSGEYVESSVIFIYGITNVWLEHLGGWGGAWAASDFEHVSIAFLFLGGGLCGMLVESPKIRSLLNMSISTIPFKSNASDEDLRLRMQPKVYRTSTNIMPALVIMLLGIMMSSHHQESMVSTMIHSQWGTLLVGFSLARAVTYILLYLNPPSSIYPSRPPSELVSAFCLISGGLLFMASTKDIVDQIEYFGLDAMFIFTVSMGLTSLMMAWVVLVLAIKGWAVRKASPHSAVSEVEHQA